MSPQRLRGQRSPAFFRPLQFGGWQDYQEWVDHDFLPCPGFTGADTENEAETSAAAPETPPERTESPDVEDDPPPEQIPGAVAADSLAADLNAADLKTVAFRYETELVVRPYVRTGGRAAPTHDLRLETLLRSQPSWRQLPQAKELPDNSEIGKVCALCEATLSLAELSAYLRAPLGVVRILVDDAVNLGLVSISANETSAAGPSMDLLRRVHKGLLELT